MRHVPVVLRISIVIVIIITIFLGVYYYTVSMIEPYTPDAELDDIVREMYDLHPTVQNLKFSEGDKSYTINKKNVYICMRDENGEYYDRNFLKFVVLHEISHTLCDEIGHTPKFTRIFGDVLDRAAALGIYDPSGKKIQNYCNYKK